MKLWHLQRKNEVFSTPYVVIYIFQLIIVYIYKFPILSTLKIPHSSDSILVELLGYKFLFGDKNISFRLNLQVL